jgi:predicted SnoaL-like aldol condensation-catalyzing enzyme
MARNNELKEWKNRLEVSHRKFKTIEPKIDRAWKYYRGDQWGTNDLFGIESYKDRVVDNVVFANIRAIVPRLNFRNPKINIRAKREPFRTDKGIFDTIAASAYWEVVLNYYYKELKIKREAKKCLYDALLSPWGIMELGYSLKTEAVESDEEDGLINELIKEDSPYVIRRDPKDFRSDIEGTDPHLNDARWIALKWIRTMNDIKNDPKMSNTTNLKPNFFTKTEFPNSGLKTNDTEETDENGIWARVQGWRIWDRKAHRMIDIVSEHDKFLRNDKEWPIDIDGFPVEVLYFNENATDLYPIPDTWLYLPMQDELNRIGSLQLDHIRRISQRRYIDRENAFTEEEKRKITHGGDGMIATTSMNPADSIMPLQDATISSDIYIIRNGLKQTIREMAGVSDAEVMSAVKFDQATEPALISQASQTLRGEQQAVFEDFLIRIVQKLGCILEDTLDEVVIPLSDEQWKDKELKKFLETKLVKMAGPQGAIILQPWLELSKKDYEGDYIYDIEIGSTLPHNETQEKQDAVLKYNLLQQNPYVRGREGTIEFLKAFKTVDPERLVKTEEEVSQGNMMGEQMRLKFEQEKNLPKIQADLQKTAMKTGATREATTIKAAMTKAQNQTASDNTMVSTKGKLLGDLLKMGEKKKNESSV